MSRWDYFNYTPTTPRPVKGGIKVEGRQGTRGKNWWAKQWIAVLESFNIGARLTRGRSYARRGQVASVDIEKGIVRAAVQGSRVKPYKVTLKVKTLSNSQWQKVIDLLSNEVIYTAKLLAGEMPADIENVFAKAGVSLFPERENDLGTNCSCPDWSNPCKHIAAVYYILGQEFDRDPFLIFKLRGLDRDELTGQLAKVGPVAEPVADEAREFHPEPLPPDPAAFWEGATLPDNLSYPVAAPSTRAAVLRQLGVFPLWRGRESIEKALTPSYINASELAIKFTAGDISNEK